jgi:integrase
MTTPAKGQPHSLVRDDLVTGFGVRRTATGSTAFFLNYIIDGRERRMTIGGYPAWAVAAARERAKELRKQVDAGEDPLERKEAARAELTLAELWTQYAAEVLPRKATTSQRNERSMWDRLILPALGRKRISKVTGLDVRQLHSQISKTTPAQANRVLASIRHVFNIAIDEWHLLKTSPVPKKLANDEHNRQRFLSSHERARFFAALDSRPDTTSALALRFLFLTGARRGEVLKATWDQFDIAEAVWVKPSSHTKQKRLHRVPISAGAVDVLRRARVLTNGDYVFSGRTGAALVEIKKLFHAVRQEAGITDFRIHDIRHSYASFLVSDGASLPVIGKLLGHTQPQTTNRYAHLDDDPLRLATNRLSHAISGQANVASDNADDRP